MGLITFDDRVLEYVPPSARHLEFALYALDRAGATSASAEAREMVADTAGSYGGPMLTLAERLDAPGHRDRHLGLLRRAGARRARRPAVPLPRARRMVFHVLDPAEIDFPFSEAASFEDLETGERMPIVPAAVREEYRALVRAHIATLGRLFTDSRIDYALFNTAVPLDHALFHYLAARERLSRAR